MSYDDSFISKASGDLNSRKYEFYFDDNYMKTSYAEAEKQCKKEWRSNGDVADFKTKFSTYNSYDVVTSKLTERIVDACEYEPEDHPRRKDYEESMRNLR